METQPKVWNGSEALIFSEEELRDAAVAHQKKIGLDKEIKAMGRDRNGRYWEMVGQSSDLKDQTWEALSKHPMYAPVSCSHLLSENRASLIAEVVSWREGTLYESVDYETGCFFAVMLRRPGVKQPYIALSKSEKGTDILVMLLLRRTGRSVRWDRTTGRPYKGADILRHWKEKAPVTLPVEAYFSHAYRDALWSEYVRQRDAVLCGERKEAV